MRNPALHPQVFLCAIRALISRERARPPFRGGAGYMCPPLPACSLGGSSLATLMVHCAAGSAVPRTSVGKLELFGMYREMVTFHRISGAARTPYPFERRFYSHEVTVFDNVGVLRTEDAMRRRRYGVLRKSVCGPNQGHRKTIGVGSSICQGPHVNFGVAPCFVVPCNREAHIGSTPGQEVRPCHSHKDNFGAL